MTLSACATDDAMEDGANDAFVSDGKADTGGIAEGSPEAAAVLHLANTFSAAQLRDDVGLAARTRNNIAAFRLGDDEAPDTTDDAVFATLAELDAVPYVGPIAFSKLLEFARDNHLIQYVTDPFADDACPGERMTLDAAQARLGALGTYQIVVRTRECMEDPAYSCTAWTLQPAAWLGWGTQASGLIELVAERDDPSIVRLNLVAERCADDDLVGTSCSGVGQRDLSCFAYSDCDPIKFVFDRAVGFRGTLTDRCLSLRAHVKNEHVWHAVEGQHYDHYAELAVLSRW